MAAPVPTYFNAIAALNDLPVGAMAYLDSNSQKS